MRSGKIRSLISAAVLAGAVGLAGPAYSANPDTNAALRYWRVWALMDPNTNTALEGVTTDNLADRSWTPTSEQLAAAATVNSDLFIRAAKMPECDFGLDLEVDGVMALMPHMAPLRVSAKAMLVQARGDAAAGKMHEAVERIAACYRAANQTTPDDMMISALVRTAIFKITDAAASSLVLDADGKEILREALAGYGDDDPFKIKAAITAEHRISIGWLQTKMKQGPGPEFDRLLDSLGLTKDAKDKAQALIRDPARLNKNIELLDQYYTLGIGALGKPDAEAVLGKLEQEAAKGAFGDMAGFFTPPFVMLSKRMSETTDQVAKAKARVTN